MSLGSSGQGCPVQKPIKCNSVGAGHVSHCRTSDFHIIIFINASSISFDIIPSDVQRFCDSLPSVVFSHVLCDKFLRAKSFDRNEFPRAKGRQTSMTKSHRSRAGIQPKREPASKEMTSASVILCETGDFFLHVQLLGTNVRLQKLLKMLPGIDLEFSRSPATSES